MSDIAIRFDGLLLAATIAVSAVLFAVIALIALLLAVFFRAHRSHLLAFCRVTTAQCGISLACLGAVALYLEYRAMPAQGPDWIDWLSVPWIMLTAFGIFHLIRFRRAPRKAH